MFIFWHTVTIAVVNSWLKYREDYILSIDALSETRVPLKRAIARALISAGKGKYKRGCLSAEAMPKKNKKTPTTITPSAGLPEGEI